MASWNYGQDTCRKHQENDKRPAEESTTRKDHVDTRLTYEASMAITNTGARTGFSRLCKVQGVCARCLCKVFTWSVALCKKPVPAASQHMVVEGSKSRPSISKKKKAARKKQGLPQQQATRSAASSFYSVLSPSAVHAPQSCSLCLIMHRMQPPHWFLGIVSLILGVWVLQAGKRPLVPFGRHLFHTYAAPRTLAFRETKERKKKK